MNAYDTEVAEGLLASTGYTVINENDIAKSQKVPGTLRTPKRYLVPFGGADVVLMNTCSVREHAEDRVFGRLGMLGVAKKENPNLIVGLMGCMVEEHREKLFRRYPQLDLMVGTRNIKELPGLIDQVRKERKQVARIKQDGISIEYTEQIQRKGEFHAWLPIMTGCNKVCTFCIVPITRGSEVSMSARDVYREASRLVSEGVQWITLLGQNVNSYDGRSAPHPNPLPIGERESDAKRHTGEGISFPELLDQLCEIEGLHKISFTTSHPHDATPELYRVIAKNSKISRRFHLPLQSGSDAVLKRMKRLHTYAEYKKKIDRMREMIPGVAITTDIISGFSGETEEDHEKTKQAFEEIRFDNAYVYKYSIRPGTPASNLPDDVPLNIKEARNAELLEIRKRISTEANRNQIGKTVGAFVEAINPKNADQVVARADDEKRLVFPGEASLIGSFQKVRLIELNSETFTGEIVTPTPVS